MDEIIFPDRNSLRADYDKFFPARTLAVRDLLERVERALKPLASRPRVMGRVKSFSSYFRKHIRLLKNGVSANPRISDLIGIRVICPFLEDLSAAEELLKKNFRVVEVERKGGDHTFREFGYESIHVLIAVPEDLAAERGIKQSETAEIQIRTILQDAWAEVEHELVYKAEFTPFDNPLKRKLAAVNASLSLADVIFQEVRTYQRGLNSELKKRRDSFFRKIEETSDLELFTEEQDGKPFSAESSLGGESGGEAAPAFDFLRQRAEGTRDAPAVAREESAESSPASGASAQEAPASGSIDDLLVEALSAHNKNDFPRAIAVYTRILDMKPDDAIRSLIYKHRGMAFFARSHYEGALADFAESLRLDPKSYKSAYYEGVVCSVLQKYPQAADAFTRALAINPYQPYCLFRRGQAFYHMDDYPKALGDCEAALALESFEAVRKLKALLLEKLKM